MSQRDPNADPNIEELPKPPDEGAAAPAAPKTMPYNREQFRDQWMQTGTDVGKQNALLGQYGLSADAAGRVALPQDVNGHSAETLDLRIGAKSGQNLAGWTDVGMNGNSNGTGGSGGFNGTGGGTGGASGSSPQQDAIRAALMAQLQKMGQPIDPNDPTISTQLNASSNLLERQRQQRRAAMAERMAASGLNPGGAGSGAMDQEIAAGFEDKASQLSGIQGQLMARANEQRISQLQQALSLAVQSGDAQSARDLQLQIAQMQQSMEQARLGQSQSQWNDTYGLQSARDQYERDRDAARAKAGLNF